LAARVRGLCERVPFLRPHYPRIITQKSLDHTGVRFEVTNTLEADRVRYLDDEEAFLTLLLNHLTADDILFDIGACVGVVALHAALRCHHVFAFEPDPGFQRHLQRNCELNGIRNVTIVPWAVADVTGSALLHTDGVGGRSPSLFEHGQRDAVTVDTRALDDALRGELPIPTVIKMDIEGAEYLALKGMRRLLLSTPPRAIFLEVHPVFLARFGVTTGNIIELLRQCGYNCSSLSPRADQVHYVFTHEQPGGFAGR
jgi:FkbM family methyltransferase